MQGAQAASDPVAECQLSGGDRDAEGPDPAGGGGAFSRPAARLCEFARLNFRRAPIPANTLAYADGHVVAPPFRQTGRIAGGRTMSASLMHRPSRRSRGFRLAAMAGAIALAVPAAAATRKSSA